jgi:hypothetical protein
MGRACGMHCGEVRCETLREFGHLWDPDQVGRHIGINVEVGGRMSSGMILLAEGTSVFFITVVNFRVP